MGVLEEQHVAVVPGTAFDEKQEFALRIAHSAPLEDVTESIRRLIECGRAHQLVESVRYKTERELA